MPDSQFSTNLKLLLKQNIDNIPDLLSGTDISPVLFVSIVEKIGDALTTESGEMIKVKTEKDLEPISKFKFTDEEIEIINQLANKLKNK